MALSTVHCHWVVDLVCDPSYPIWVLAMLLDASTLRLSSAKKSPIEWLPLYGEWYMAIQLAISFLGMPAISMPALVGSGVDDSSLTAQQADDIQLRFAGQYKQLLECISVIVNVMIATKVLVIEFSYAQVQSSGISLLCTQR